MLDFESKCNWSHPIPLGFKPYIIPAISKEVCQSKGEITTNYRALSRDHYEQKQRIPHFV